MLSQFRYILPTCLGETYCLTCVRKLSAFREPSPTNFSADYTSRIHVIGNSVIDCVVKKISSDLRSEKSVIMEVNPGPGFLLEALLRAGAPRVFGLYEESSPYLSALEVSSNYHCARIYILCHPY